MLIYRYVTDEKGTMSLVFRLKRSVVRSAKSLARVTVKFGVGVVSYLAFDNHVATLRKVEVK